MHRLTSDDFLITFEPIGKRTRINGKKTLLEASRQAGVDLISICGGNGTCGHCKIIITTGHVSPTSELDKKALTQTELKEGYRLACQTYPCSDLVIDIPGSSLTTVQRTQLEGIEIHIEGDPIIKTVEISVKQPSLQDLRSDQERFLDALIEKKFRSVSAPVSMLRILPQKLRENGWNIKVILRVNDSGWSVVGICKTSSPVCGIAIDIGTTKLAMYLVNLETKETLARIGEMNPQIAYGEDVVSRIAYCNKEINGITTLQRVLVKILNKMIIQCCKLAGLSTDSIVEVTAVGNTAMHHLFCGLPVKQLGEAPYVPAITAPIEFPAREIGLNVPEETKVYLPPNIAGYVGADHISMLVSTGAWQAKEPTIAIDIGTNTEISLVYKGTHLACSCASGPAFEGAHISAGMRAAKGAIERVRLEKGEIQIKTINDSPPIGICGSGILDAVAMMLEHGLMDGRGRLDQNHPLISTEGLLLSEKQESKDRNPIYITREDIYQIQLAKAAIQTGLNALLEKGKVTAKEIRSFIIAGAFGTYIDVSSAVKIGMFPQIDEHTFKQVGNAAGMGARELLLSKQKRQDANKISKQVTYLELTTFPNFMDEFMKALYF